MHRLQKDNYLSLISILVAILLFISWIKFSVLFLIFSVTLSIPILLNPKYLALTLSITLIAILINYLYHDKEYWGYVSNYKTKVIRSTNSGPIIEYDDSRIQVYSKELYFKGDQIIITGRVQTPKYNYLESKHVLSVMYKPKISLIKESSQLKPIIYRKIHNKEIYGLLYLGIHKNNNLYDKASEMNITHLFSISGFHIGLIYGIIAKLHKKFKIRKWVGSINGLSITLFYVFILGFPVSALRAWLIILTYSVNKFVLRNKYKKHTLFSLVLGIVFIIDPISSLSLSFQLSFMASYIIILINMMIEKTWKKFLYISILINLITMPIIVYSFGKYSLLSILYNLILTPIYPIFFIGFICLYPFWDINKGLQIMLEKIIDVMHKINYSYSFNDILKNNFINIYFLIPGTFIIYKIWFFYMGKKSFLLTKK